MYHMDDPVTALSECYLLDTHSRPCVIASALAALQSGTMFATINKRQSGGPKDLPLLYCLCVPAGLSPAPAESTPHDHQAVITKPPSERTNSLD